MKTYVPISSDDYCIKELTCSCAICGKVFAIHIPNDYELVQFICNDRSERYLPSYGPHGYLNLLQYLISEWAPGKSITPHISDMFAAKLSEICPYSVRIFTKSQIRCPSCNSAKFIMQKEKVVHNLPVEWIEIQEEFIKKLL